MLIRLTIVGIPCLKINAAAGYYQWVRDKRNKIYSSKSQKKNWGKNVLLLSLINQTQFITPLRSSVCLYLCFFVCLDLCFFVSLLFIPAVSGKFVLKTGCVFMWPVWNPRYISKCRDVCFNAQRTASISC